MLKRAQEQKRLGSGDIRWLPAHVKLRKDVSARLGRNVDLGEGQLMNIKRAGGHDRALVLAKPTFDRTEPTELSLDVGGDIDGGAGLGSGAGAVVSETPGAADPVTALLNVQPADSPSIAEGLGMGSPSVGGLGLIVDRNGLTNQAQLSQLADQGPGAEVETRPRLRSVSIDELEPSGSFESESLKQAKAVWSNKANHHISRMKLRKAPLRALNDFGDEAGPSSRASRTRAASQAKRRGAGGGRSARPDEAGGAARARRAEVESRPRQQQLEEQHMLQQQVGRGSGSGTAILFRSRLQHYLTTPLHPSSLTRTHTHTLGLLPATDEGATDEGALPAGLCLPLPAVPGAVAATVHNGCRTATLLAYLVVLLHI